jgi:hypothetical protein
LGAGASGFGLGDGNDYLQKLEAIRQKLNQVGNQIGKGARVRGDRASPPPPLPPSQQQLQLRLPQQPKPQLRGAPVAPHANPNSGVHASVHASNSNASSSGSSSTNRTTAIGGNSLRGSAAMEGRSEAFHDGVFQFFRCRLSRAVSVKEPVCRLSVS